MSQIDRVVRYSKKLEKHLEQHYGASGRGLHEKATSVADQLTPATLKSLRWVATMRNKVVHEDDFALDDLQAFEQCCEQLLSTLQPNQPTVSITRTPTVRPIVDLDDILINEHTEGRSSVKPPKTRTRKNTTTIQPITASNMEPTPIQPPLTVQPKVKPTTKPKTNHPPATPRLQPSVQPAKASASTGSRHKATTNHKTTRQRMHPRDQPYHGQAALISVGLLLALTVWIFLR